MICFKNYRSNKLYVLHAFILYYFKSVCLYCIVLRKILVLRNVMSVACCHEETCYNVQLQYCKQELHVMMTNVVSMFSFRVTVVHVCLYDVVTCDMCSNHHHIIQYIMLVVRHQFPIKELSWCMNSSSTIIHDNQLIRGLLKPTK
jgi:hypothetical protein